MIIVYFSIYCFLGYWIESVYLSLLHKKWISSGLLKGPFIPLYGFGTCLLILFQDILFKFHPFISSVLGGILLTLFELFSSYYIEKSFHTRCWDYSHHHFQYQGRVCLIYFFLWCILSDVFLYFIHPYFSSLNILNDASYLLSLIYISFIIKAYGKRLLISQQDGIKIH